MQFDAEQLAEYVIAFGDELKTDSRRVAKHFGKRHDNVLQTIDRMRREMPAEDHRLSFQEMVIPTLVGSGASRDSRVVSMTKDGFMLLAMSFTGKKAMLTKIAFVRAFNQLAASARHIGASLWDQRRDLEEENHINLQFAKYGSELMLNRKLVWLPYYRPRKQHLDNTMQLSLFTLLDTQQQELSHAE